MELDPETIRVLLAHSPWLFVAALTLWPGTGVVALLIKRNEAIKLAELERGMTHDALAREARQALPKPRQKGVPHSLEVLPSGEGR